MRKKTKPNVSIIKIRQLIFDSVIILGYLGVAIFLIWMFHSDGTNKELAYSLFIGFGGITIGWLIGVLSSPFSKSEKKSFNQIRTAIIGFLSGYFFSKIEPVFSWAFEHPELITTDDTILRLLIFVSGGIFGFIYMLIYRKYYIKEEGIEMV